jgi:Alkylmercury lyase
VTDLPALDASVRLHIITQLLDRGAAPSIANTADALGASEADAAAAYDRLAAGRIIVLRPGTRDVMMAAPLSAGPTPHIVRLADGRTRYGNCVWDAMGVLAMTASDGDVDTTCQDCGAPLHLSVRNGTLTPSDAVVHFAVPASRWWEDIVFT